MRTVWIGGSFTSRERLRPYRETLKALGYGVCASWLDEPQETLCNLEQAAQQAYRDLLEMKQADLFIFDTIEPPTMGNSYAEFGYALSRCGPRYLVGPVRNHYLTLYTRRFGTWEECLEYLRT